MEKITNDVYRRSQRNAALLAVCILVGLLILMPLGGGLGDFLNSAYSPTTEASRYKEVDTQSGVTFNMDSTAFHKSGSYKSYYIWKNATGYLNYCNVTHTSGVISVTSTSTAGNAITGNISWTKMHPEYQIFLDYTAMQAYSDNVIRVWLQIDNLFVSAHPEARTITLSAGGVTFYTTTLAETSTDKDIDVNITVNVNDLRRAIISAGSNSYFLLEVTAQDTSLSIAGSGMYMFNLTKPIGRDDALYFIGGLACAVTLAGVFLVQPHYGLPFGGNKKQPRRY